MLKEIFLGKLSWNVIPFHAPIIMSASIFMGIVALIVLGAITYFKKWNYLWKEWICTVDHKKIGVMYLILSAVMLLRGFSDAVMMRVQQAIAVDSPGYLPPEHYDQIFTAHGVIMIFFVAMPLMFALMNFAIPLQIGARDVAYPYLNSLSFWLTAVGAGLVLISLVVGDFARTGWLAYPPLSETVYSPTVGVDYWLWSIQISGIGSLLSGVNFFATIIKMRCPGMDLMKMPLFTWSSLCSVILIILAFPILTVSLALLFLDRYFGMHFFTSDFGGNQMMYVNLIWAWGHPEVYILVLPAFGIFSEVVSTFSKKPLFGYAAMVWATIVITFQSFIVWLHHFFTMGAGADVNAFFGIATMIIAIPTGVKIFNWLATMYRGRITFATPMLWMMGFLTTFAIGGMTGVLMAMPPADFQIHNSVFLVGHFHNVIIGGVVFGFFAGITYWFPKIFGFKLNETLGKWAWGFWLVGYLLAFMPLYALGLMGMTRRLNHYASSTGWHPLLMVAAIGTAIIFIGVIFQILQYIISIKNREKYKVGNDPWEGRTLEWSIPSPAPFYNFSTIPTVDSRDPFWKMKKEGHVYSPHYEDIHMPKDTAQGFVIAIFAAVFGFSIIWNIYGGIFLGLIGIFISVIFRAFNPHTDYYIKAEKVKTIEESIGKIAL